MEFPSPEDARDETEASLERERVIWLGLRARLERTGGRDAQLAGIYKTSNDMMNSLLETYFDQNMMLEAFNNIEVGCEPC